MHAEGTQATLPHSSLPELLALSKHRDLGQY